MKQYEHSNIKIPRNFINSEEISLNLQCSICNEIFNNPMRLDCGHTYCYDCIKNWISKKNQCPNCRQKIVESLISRDLLAYNIINDLEVSCNNENKGCPWKGPLLSLENHMKICNDNIDLLIKDNKKEKEKTPDENEEKQSVQVSSKTPIKTISQLLKRRRPLEETPQQENKKVIEMLIHYNQEKLPIKPQINSEQKQKLLEIFKSTSNYENENKYENNQLTCSKENENCNK